MKNSNQGTYAISLSLKDSSGAQSEAYIISFTVTGDAEIEPVDLSKATSFTWAWEELGDAEIIESPKPKVSRISDRGLVKILWDKNIARPRSIRKFPELTTQWTYENGSTATVPVLDVQILRGSFSQESDLGFKWKIE